MTKFEKALTAAAMAAVLTVSQAMAAEGPLPGAGKPAGVQAAQGRSRTNLLLIGAGVLVTVVAVVVAVQSSNNAVCGAACTVPSSTS